MFDAAPLEPEQKPVAPHIAIDYSYYFTGL